ncbi:Ig-like domain-containing protein, partial [Aerococcaceae bacterium NML160702]|nr:Ig-like domain-containing protein [Aerococcaceae bacterium NML160702]
MQNLYKKINNLLIVLLLITNVLTPSISVFATGTDVETPVVEMVESVVESETKPDAPEEKDTEALELEVASSQATDEEEADEAEEAGEIYLSPVDPSAYLTNVTLTHTSGQSANGGEIGYHDNFKLSYAFNFPNSVAINNGDTLTLNIPNEMRLLRDDNFPITKDGAPIGMAQVSVANKTIVVTFNDYFQNNPNDKNMQLTVSTAWDTSVVSGGESLNLVFNGQIVPINVGTKPQIGTTEVLQKWGNAVQNDANRYNWFMRINNARHNLNSVEIIDTLGPGQELDVNSIRIDFLNSYEPWQPYTGTAPTPVWVEKTTRGFKLNFNNLDAVVAINYQVVVTDPDLAEYQNSVELKANGQTKDNITRTVANQSGSGSGGGSGIKPTPKIGLEVIKELTGRGLQDGEFEFTLTKHRDTGDEVVETVRNTGSRVIFQGFPYHKAGTYRYTVQEVKGNLPDVTYSEERIEITVEVVNNNGQLVANVIYPADKTFNNIYSPTQPAKPVIRATIQSEGCVVGNIEVELVNDQNVVVQTKSVSANGDVEFTLPDEMEASNKTYKLRQKNVVDTASIDYDNEEKSVTVTVVKSPNENKFVATVNPEKVIFNNTCKPTTPAGAVIKASVAANGCVVAPIEVELLDSTGNNVLQTVRSTAEGKVTFAAIPQNAIGNVTYKVRQKNPVDTAHVRFDKTVKEVTVRVTKDANTNKFVATVDPAEVMFNNECLPPTPTNATIKATVKAEGCVVGEVKVELVDDKGQVVATATANDKGEVSFNVPNLNAAKTYNYKLRQKDVVDTPHVRYDKAEKPVAVTVTLNNTTNQFEATTPETVVFNNECLPPTPINATIKATVKAEGCVVGPVKVELVDDKGQVVATATANDKGEVSFNVPNLNAAKTYNYKLRQKDVVDTP